jgi:polyprenyldihydroxybenzoate methyltransferase/3-demethylubiquinol 3-O-methyltransferase
MTSIPRTATSIRNFNLLLRTAPRFVQNQFRSHTTASSNAAKSSVNPEEVSHFNALASTWWDPHGSSRLLHLMNPLRHDFIRSCHASQPTPIARDGLRYLDIGCGGGIFAESVARLGSVGSVTAVDPSPEVLAVAKAHARQDPGLAAKLAYLNTSVEELPLPKSVDEQYDVLSLFEVIEHITHPAEFLDACTPFVKPGGWIIMSTIARTWTSWITTKLVAEDIVGIVPRGTHDWEKYINEDELRGHFLRERGWNSPRVMGVVYVPGLGWKEVTGSEKLGNYFFGIRKDE